MAHLTGYTPTITGKVVLAWRVGGRRFQIEKLKTPVPRGAGLRHFRLWENGEPAFGGQWHYTLADAVWRAWYITQAHYGYRLNRAEDRIRQLEKELYFATRH